ncbi:hypothetical protein D9M71_291880 [compost metagenome]
MQSGLGAICAPDDLPAAGDMDRFIDERIKAVIRVSEGMPPHVHWKTKKLVALECSYGRAQKLVNMFLKSKLFCAGFDQNERVAALHPPLDDVLLTAIDLNQADYPPETREEFETAWAAARKLGTAWTKFNQPTYEAYIKAIRLFMAGSPLWQVEYLWNAVAPGA